MAGSAGPVVPRRHAGARLCRPWRPGARESLGQRARWAGQSAASRRVSKCGGGNPRADLRRRAQPVVLGCGWAGPPGRVCRGFLPLRYAHALDRCACAIPGDPEFSVYDHGRHAGPRGTGVGGNRRGGPLAFEPACGRPGIRAGARDRPSGGGWSPRGAWCAQLHVRTRPRRPGGFRWRRNSPPGRALAICA